MEQGDGRLVPDGRFGLEWDGPLVAPAKSPVTQILTIARNQKWILISAVVIAMVVGLIVSLLMTPMYRAGSTIEIQREGQNFTNVEGAEGREAAALDPEFYSTQAGLLKGRSLAERVAAKLRLQNDPEFFRMFKSPAAENWFENGKLLRSAPAEPERVRAAASILLNNIEVKGERSSRLYEIVFTSPSPALSKRVSDAWGQNFIQQTLERRYAATADARRFLEDRLAQLRSRIDTAERQAVAYAAREGIVNLGSDIVAGSSAGGGQASAAERSLVASDLAAFSNALSEARQKRIVAESRLNQRGEAPEAMMNTTLSQLRTKRVDLVTKYAELMERFEPDYPPAVSIQAQIRQVDSAIATETSRVGSSLRRAYEEAVKNEQELNTQVEELKASLFDLRRRSTQYAIFQREVDTSRQLYDALLQRYKEIGIAGGVGVNNISIVDEARFPRSPSSPNLPLNMVLALFVGLAIGAGIALLREHLNDGVDDPSEIAESLNVALLGTLPRIQGDDVLDAVRDPKEMLAEAYFSVLTGLQFSTAHGFPHSLAVTSSRPSEGKSTTAFAMAMTLAKPTRTVLLIDADMRSPSQHHILDMKNTAGLSNLLSGSDDLEAMIKPTTFPGLYLLSAGPQPPSAADLLSGERFGNIVAQLAERFDHIVVDAPPVMGLADAPLIASKLEGTVFVIEAHSTGKGVARMAINRLQAAQARLAGVIISKFDTKRAHYGYGYDYGYSYNYGQGNESARG